MRASEPAQKAGRARFRLGARKHGTRRHRAPKANRPCRADSAHGPTPLPRFQSPSPVSDRPLPKERAASFALGVAGAHSCFSGGTHAQSSCDAGIVIFGSIGGREGVLAQNPRCLDSRIKACSAGYCCAATLGTRTKQKAAPPPALIAKHAVILRGWK
ncbi:hypothetical protein MRX96_026894 [Rhipicephalus microplus]